MTVRRLSRQKGRHAGPASDLRAADFWNNNALLMKIKCDDKTKALERSIIIKPSMDYEKRHPQFTFMSGKQLNYAQ